MADAASSRARWYHGSPLRLSRLAAGSSVTMSLNLARVFAHRPAVVSLEDDGTLRHDGRLPGYLPIVSEPVGSGDLMPHPRSTMPPGEEWLTSREQRLKLVGLVEVLEREALSEAEAARLSAVAQARIGSHPHDQVCPAAVQLRDAQIQSSGDWLAVYATMPRGR